MTVGVVGLEPHQSLRPDGDGDCRTATAQATLPEQSHRADPARPGEAQHDQRRQQPGQQRSPGAALRLGRLYPLVDRRVGRHQRRRSTGGVDPQRHRRAERRRRGWPGRDTRRPRWRHRCGDQRRLHGGELARCEIAHRADRLVERLREIARRAVARLRLLRQHPLEDRLQRGRRSGRLD